MKKPNTNPVEVEKLLFTAEEFEALLGISAATRWRLEQRGLIKAVPGIRRKLYSRAAVVNFINGVGSEAASKAAKR